ncbi:MAG: hypothetical protein WCQ32_02050 [bacterium]
MLKHIGDVILIVLVFLLAVWFLPIVPTKQGNAPGVNAIQFETGQQWFSQL